MPRNRTRIGFTLVEVVVATLAGSLVLGCLFTVFLSIRRMARYGELAGTYQDGALALAMIQQDIARAVRKPGGSDLSPIVPVDGGFEMLRAEPGPGGSVGARKVVYRRLLTRAGLFRLKRQTGSEERLIPGLFRDVRFALLGGPGGPFIRVTLTLATGEAAGEPDRRGEPRDTVLSCLSRVMGPEMLDAGAMGWEWLDPLQEAPGAGDS